MNEQTETIEIGGMSCQHCVRAVREALEETEGVEVLDVGIGTARVRFNPERVDRTRIAEAIEEAGYTPRP